MSNNDAVCDLMAENGNQQVEIERLNQQVFMLIGALKIAQKFCNNCTADECPDDVAIPINDALRAYDGH